MKKALQEKIEISKQLIYEQRNVPSVVYCSFGKDSTVMLHLVREVMPVNPLTTEGAYPRPVIYHRQPWFPDKNKFADELIRKWGIEVYDFPPFAAGVKMKPAREHNNNGDGDRSRPLELVARYSFGHTYIDLPMSTEKPVTGRPYMCGLHWLLRPGSVATFPWKVAFVGHKSSDVDPFEGRVPLRGDSADVGNVHMVFPLRDWTDDDLWDYIELAKVPFDTRRYKNRQEVPDRWHNPDYFHTCTACIDPRETAEEVMCPKLKRPVPNSGPGVTRLETLPDYIEKV
jgi:3'-phosphoadenosine 5'-phosphosulfate sulfotransferase (PAPS reductase)/FAD synthetase